MTAIELEQVFDQLNPHQQHYFRFPDSEMVTFDKYRIVFPKWDKAENRQNYVTDNNLTVPFDDIKVEEKEIASAKGVLNGYFNGSYSELEVAEYDNWTIDEIHDRGVKMLKFIEERWDINLEEEGFDIERILGINVNVNDKKRVSSLPDFSEELDDGEEDSE